METLNTIAELLNVMEAAIKSGDWNVDGACDPDSIMYRAEVVLRKFGFTRNSIDDHWMQST